MAGVLGTLLVVLGVVAYAVISSLLNRFFVGTAFGEDAACALMTGWLTGVAIAFILYEAIFILWQFDILKKTRKNGDDGKSKKTFILIAIGCICASLLVAVVFANTYVDCREDSISKVCFVKTKEYRWNDKNDVLRYSLSCDSNGGLTFNITMKDGEVIELLGNVTSISDSFKEKYHADKVDLLAYAADLAEQFDSGKFIIDKRISGSEYMERFYKEDHPEIWVYLESIINSTYN